MSRSSFKPIFIVGHSRSGSTLLSTILGRHPNLISLPETHYCGSSYAGNFFSRYVARKNINKIYSYAIDRNVRLADLVYSKSEVLRHLSGLTKIMDQDVFEGLLMSAANAQGGGRVVEKTPYHIEHIDRLITWFPDAKIICMLRDGRDAIQSLMNVPWTHSNPQRHAAYWSWCVRTALSKTRKHAGKVIIVKYEDLVLEYHSTMERIGELINEDLSVLTSTDTGGTTVPEWEHQWKSNSLDGIDKGNVYKWKMAGTQELQQWTYWIRNELDLLGYPASEMVRVPLKFIYRPDVFDIAYSMWCLYRTNVSARSNRYRRNLL